MMMLESEELPVLAHVIAYEGWVSVNFPCNTLGVDNIVIQKIML
jgi:hypothetical protein